MNVGKFPNPIFRVGEMVFDEDLSLEGPSETFQLLDKPLGSLDQVKVHALEWTFNEISNAHGWQAGPRLGQTKAKDDWSLYGFHEHIGQEAAISAFTYSDFGLGGTNVEGPVVGMDYQLPNPLALSVRSHFTNFINRPTGLSNPTLTRLQLDAVVKF